MILVLLALHMLAALFWVGGMLFAHTVLRPAVAGLDAAARPALWRGVFARFLPGVGIAILVLLATGFAMIALLFGGFAAVPLYVSLMMGLGILMMLLFGHVYLALWPRFGRALGAGDAEACRRALLGVRRLVEINLLLGLVTVVIAVTGRYWG